MNDDKKEKYMEKIGIIVIISLLIGIFLGIFSPIFYDHLDKTFGLLSLMISVFFLIVGFFFGNKISLKSKSAKIILYLGALFCLSLIIGFNLLIIFDINFEVSILYFIYIGVLLFALATIGKRTAREIRKIPISDYYNKESRSGNVLEEILENRTPEHIKKLLKKLSKTYFIATVITYIILLVFSIFAFFTVEFDIFIYMLFFCIIMVFITTLIFEPKRKYILKNTDNFRRKIIITDKEIQIPFQQSFKLLSKAIFVSVRYAYANPAEMIAFQNSAYIKYEEIKKCYLNYEKGTMKIVTKNFPIELYLTEENIKKIAEYIKKNSKKV